jgi:ribonuclease T2
LIGDFIAANPGLKPDMMSVQCGGAGNRLKEVRVCFTKEGEFRACGRNEDQRRLCSAERMYVPPVRAGATKE